MQEVNFVSKALFYRSQSVHLLLTVHSKEVSWKEELKTVFGIY